MSITSVLFIKQFYGIMPGHTVASETLRKKKKKEYAVWSGCASTLESLSDDGILEPQAQVLNTDSDLMANMCIVLNCRRKLMEHAYGYYGMELKLTFSSL
jgi:hypothetical protein